MDLEPPCVGGCWRIKLYRDPFDVPADVVPRGARGRTTISACAVATAARGAWGSEGLRRVSPVAARSAKREHGHLGETAARFARRVGAALVPMFAPSEVLPSSLLSRPGRSNARNRRYPVFASSCSTRRIVLRRRAARSFSAA